MVTETQFLDQGFRLEAQELSDQWTALNLSFSDKNSQIAGKIQILIVISSPELSGAVESGTMKNSVQRPKT